MVYLFIALSIPQEAAEFASPAPLDVFLSLDLDRCQADGVYCGTSRGQPYAAAMAARISKRMAPSPDEN
jgi:hypothetical protein